MDLDTAWERVPVSDVAKQTIWRLESDRYALTSPSLYDLGRQLPEYYSDDPEGMSYRVVEQLRREAWEKFAAMDMFFVKVCSVNDPVAGAVADIDLIGFRPDVYCTDYTTSPFS